MSKRVVITGVGCITPLGGTTEQLWHGLTQGKSGIGRLSLFDATNYPVRIAAEVKDWSMADVGESPRQWEHAPRQTRFMVGAGLLAAREAGLPSNLVDPTRMGVYLGCGEAFEDFPSFMQSIDGASEDGAYQPQEFIGSALRIFRPETEREYEPNTPAAHLSAYLNAQGPNANCIAACVSSAQAIGEAARLIRHGSTKVMLAGGAHSTINGFGLTGFHNLSALSQNNDSPESAARPFDKERDGFVIGEGAACFVLEELDHARMRGAEIWAELTGYGSAQDAYRVTDSHPEGRGITQAITKALHAASLNTTDIDYINAHGTGTVMNDKVETAGIKRVFGQEAYSTPISSSKSMLGHATTASGAVELAVSLLAMKHQVAPPTVNYSTPDPDCDLDYIPNIARELDVQHILSNSIGFGGQNAALIISRFDERTPGRIALRATA